MGLLASVMFRLEPFSYMLHRFPGPAGIELRFTGLASLHFEVVRDRKGTPPTVWVGTLHPCSSDHGTLPTIPTPNLIGHNPLFTPAVSFLGSDS